MADRHQFRAKWHDYNTGLYFVTICTHEKRHIFGHIVSENSEETRFIASELGEIVDGCIKKIPDIHPDVEVCNYVVMPNHIHMVLSVGAQYIAPAATEGNFRNTGCLKPPMHGDPVEDNHFNSRLAVVIRTFKAAVTREARAQSIAPLQVWQRSFHDHIIREQHAFDNIMNYVDTNAENWNMDCFLISK